MLSMFGGAVEEHLGGEVPVRAAGVAFHSAWLPAHVPAKAVPGAGVPAGHRRKSAVPRGKILNAEGRAAAVCRGRGSAGVCCRSFDAVMFLACPRGLGGLGLFIVN